jgi:hypothetical protein
LSLQVAPADLIVLLLEALCEEANLPHLPAHILHEALVLLRVAVHVDYARNLEVEVRRLVHGPRRAQHEDRRQLHQKQVGCVFVVLIATPKHLVDCVVHVGSAGRGVDRQDEAVEGGAAGLAVPRHGALHELGCTLPAGGAFGDVVQCREEVPNVVSKGHLGDHAWHELG